MKKKRTSVFPEADDGELSFQPLSMFSLLLSVAAILNAQAQYLNANTESLKETGGFNAATDCEQGAGFLLAVVEQNLETFMSQRIQIPRGWGYIAMSNATILNEEQADLPF